MSPKIILDENAMNRAITRISYEIIEYNKGTSDLIIIGILSRGVEIANKITSKINSIENSNLTAGSLDITLFRDDIKTPSDYIDKSDFEQSIEGKTIVLVDDVIYTGRSVRGAIDAIMEHGRPKCIKLAVLVDRGHRELPIRADFIGKNLPTSKSETVKVLVKERDNENKVILI